jgi:hypothetical protein
MSETADRHSPRPRTVAVDVDVQMLGNGLFPVEGVARGSGRGWRGRRVGACGGVEVFRGWEFRHCPPS